MFINFQQNRAIRSVITAHTNVFAKKQRKMHKRRTAGRTDGQTDRRRVRQQSVVFLRKKLPKTNACEAYKYFFAMQECTLKIMLV